MKFVLWDGQEWPILLCRSTGKEATGKGRMGQKRLMINKVKSCTYLQEIIIGANLGHEKESQEENRDRIRLRSSFSKHGEITKDNLHSHCISPVLTYGTVLLS